MLKLQVPNVYESHKFLDDALAPFVPIRDTLVVLETAESPNWKFILYREGRKISHGVLTAECQMNSDAGVKQAIRTGITAMILAQ